MKKTAPPPARIFATPLWRRAKQSAVWLLVAGVFFAVANNHQQQVLEFLDPAGRPQGPLEPADPDVWLYLTQTRQWLAGGFAGFFDHTVQNTNAPFGGIAIHWTRPMEMLIALAYSLVPAGFPVDFRLMLAANWLAPALCLLATALLAAAMRPETGTVRAAGFAGLLMFNCPDTYDYFEPGNADHHGLLSALWCLALVLLLRRRPDQKTFFFLGAVLGLMIWISPEALALAGLVCAVFGFLALRAPENTRALVAVTLGAALVATFGVFVEVPPGPALLTPHYDTLSIVQVALLWLAAAGALALRAAFARLPGWRQRLAAAAGTGALLLGFFYAVFPKFFGGPFVEADPFIMSDLMPRMTELMPVFSLPPADCFRELFEPLLAAALLSVALLRPLRAGRRRRLALLAALLAATLAPAVYQARWVYYLHPVSIVAIGMAANALAAHPKSPLGDWLYPAPRAWRPFLLLVLCFAGLTALLRQLPADDIPDAPCMAQLRYVIESRQLQQLLGDHNLVLATDSGAGGDVLFFTPFRIIASNFHREGAGLKYLAELSSAPSAAAARPLIEDRKVDALLYCPREFQPGSWLHGLDARRHPAWLKPVAGLTPFTSAAKDVSQKNGAREIPPEMPLLFRVKT